MSSHLIVPIPLRADGTTAYLDLPPDLTPEEARKIANVALAYATPSIELQTDAGTLKENPESLKVDGA